MRDTTHEKVPLATGTYEGSGVVKNETGPGRVAISWSHCGLYLPATSLLTQVPWQPSRFMRWLCVVPWWSTHRYGVRVTCLWKIVAFWT